VDFILSQERHCSWISAPSQIWVRGYKSFVQIFKNERSNFCTHAPKSVGRKWTSVSEARSQSEDVAHAEGDDNDTAGYTGSDAAQERLDEEEESGNSWNTWGHAARRLTFQECG
jgi:hypothetical protein